MAFAIRARGGYALPVPRPVVGAPGTFVGSGGMVSGSLGSIAGVFTVATGLWAGPRQTVGIQWYRGAGTIAGATSASYVIAATDRTASYVTAKITNTNQWGSTVVNIVHSVTIP